MGGKKTEIINFETADKKKISIPVATIVGDSPGPDAVITAGIHGREYGGILSAIQLLQQLTPSDINGSVKIITVCDTAASEWHSGKESPIDGLNLNRCFPGRQGGSYSVELAARIFDEIKGADYHMDIHSGLYLESCIPFSTYHRGRSGALNDRSHEIAYYYGLPNIVITESEGRWPDKGTCYAAAYENIGIPSALMLTGSFGVSGKEDIQRHIKGIKNVLRHFGSLKGDAAPVGRPLIHENMEWLYTKNGGIYHRMVNVGERVRRGQLIALITDYFGAPVEKIVSPINGQILILTESSVASPKDFAAAIGVTK
ncbi:MAG: succinylglutamate desuccinylase/aspartoacylase family protein [Synergistaceae bacterium]|nr:succinylglutamate desuccinylase/aspartoacylase family protein [Synergistaceae bacterium]